MTLSGLADTLAVLTLLPIGAFITLYGFRSAWGATQIGRTLMYVATSVFITRAQIALTILFGDDYPGRNYWRVAVYGLVFVVWGRMSWTLLQVQRRRTRGEEPVNDHALTASVLGRARDARRRRLAARAAGRD